MSDFKHGGGCCESCGPVTVNAEITGQIKTHTHDGAELIVVPVVAIVEGVLNNHLVPAEEFGKFFHAWEGVPVPVQHPEMNGQPVSANLPDMIDARAIGRFHNVTVNGNKLKGELWIDPAKAEKKGFSDVVEMFRNGEMVEVSTAYFADTEPTSGEFNGKSYVGIHRNLRPDHLAVLPNKVGACSVAAGCGAPRINQKGVIMGIADRLKSLFGVKTNAESFSEIESAVYRALNPKGMDQERWPVEVYDGRVVYNDGGELYSRDFSMNEGEIEFSSDPVQVRMTKDFVPVANEGDEDDTEQGAGQSVNQNHDEGETMSEQDKAPAAAPAAEQMSEADRLAVNWAREQYDAARAKHVATIKANAQNQFSDDELAGMEMSTLEKLAGSMTVTDYSQRGMPAVNSRPAGDEGLDKPAGVVTAFRQEA